MDMRDKEEKKKKKKGKPDVSRKVYTFTGIHLWLQPLSTKFQPYESQGLRVKCDINILTNRAGSQESITLSSPIGDDFISVLPCFSLLPHQGFFFSQH